LSTNIFKILEELSGQKVKYTGTIFIPFPQEKFIFSRKKKDFAVNKKHEQEKRRINSKETNNPEKKKIHDISI